MKATIDDPWPKNDDDGNPPNRAAKRSLTNSRDPTNANMPEKRRKSRHGIGMRRRCHRSTVKDGRRVQKAKAVRQARRNAGTCHAHGRRHQAGTPPRSSSGASCPGRHGRRDRNPPREREVRAKSGMENAAAFACIRMRIVPDEKKQALENLMPPRAPVGLTGF